MEKTFSNDYYLISEPLINLAILKVEEDNLDEAE